MNRKRLLEALTISRACLASHPLIPILSHFCFTPSEILTFNGTQALSVDFKSDLHCAIPGDLFYKLVSTFQTEEIEVEQDGNTVLVQSGDHVSKLATLAPTEFLFKMPSLEGLLAMSIEPDLTKGIQRCMMCANDNPVIKNQFGITFDCSPKRAALYSTDTIRISRYTLTEQPLPKTSFKVLLPKLFSALVVPLRNEQEGELYLGADFLCAQFENAALYTKVIPDINFLPFEKNIGIYLKPSTQFQLIPEQLYYVLNRALIFLNNELDQFITCKVHKNHLSVHTRCALGIMDEDVEFDCNLIEGKEEYTFQIDAKFLEQGALATKEIAFVFINNIAAFICKEDEFYYLLNSPNV